MATATRTASGMEHGMAQSFEQLAKVIDTL